MSAQIESRLADEAGKPLDIRDDLKAIVRDKWRRKEQLTNGEKMVGWFNIQQLIRTGMEVVVSSTLERHNDRRLFQALETKDATYYDYSVKWEYKSDVLGNYTKKLDKDGNPEVQSDLWIDYLSDLGDGWDPTYAVAYYANQKHLKLGEYETPRGQLVIFGGDEVYPTATREEYTNRLAKPYCAALPVVSNEDRPHLFAIPGNHDWYDSLSNFTNLFLDNQYFGNWRTPQERSYFAIKLPHHWWLVGIDLQLDSDLDGGQVDYLKKVAADMEDGDKIILCSPEPFWVYAEIYAKEEFDPKYRESRLHKIKFLEETIFKQYNDDKTLKKKQELAVYIAGDLHHYYHLVTKEGAHKITAGGGGAFLHPTHGPLENAFPGESSVAFPTKEESAQLTKLNRKFPFLNRTFGVLTMMVYWLASWTVVVFVNFTADHNKHFQEEQIGLEKSLGETLSSFGSHPWESLDRVVGSMWHYMSDAMMEILRVGYLTPILLFWVLLIGGGFWLFTDSNSIPYKKYVGILHGLLHVVFALVINVFVFWLTVGLRIENISSRNWVLGSFVLGAFAVAYLWRVGFNRIQSISGVAITEVVCACVAANDYKAETYNWGWDFRCFPQMFFSALLICLLSYFLSSFLMGFYLWISLDKFERHANEAFSSLGIQDWKNFLRMHIDKQGALTIYPIGIRRVPRKWEEEKLNGGAVTYYPADESATPPHLIEERPIFIPPPTSYKKGII